eukprot:TRINITY_DN29567_c0_g1_i1.p1 TRINITY_DN29567_c0_g1~~TRINITY_DN29567_c0_g1_i1.p1  ORF type:complete len:971 (+),score=209.49 TRINITY_DN29567_c0_g1_i1:98-3010(+)
MAAGLQPVCMEGVAAASKLPVQYMPLSRLRSQAERLAREAVDGGHDWARPALVRSADYWLQAGGGTDTGAGFYPGIGVPGSRAFDVRCIAWSYWSARVVPTAMMCALLSLLPGEVERGRPASGSDAARTAWVAAAARTPGAAEVIRGLAEAAVKQEDPEVVDGRSVSIIAEAALVAGTTDGHGDLAEALELQANLAQRTMSCMKLQRDSTIPGARTTVRLLRAWAHAGGPFAGPQLAEARAQLEWFLVDQPGSYRFLQHFADADEALSLLQALVKLPIAQHAFEARAVRRALVEAVCREYLKENGDDCPKAIAVAVAAANAMPTRRNRQEDAPRLKNAPYVRAALRRAVVHFCRGASPAPTPVAAEPGTLPTELPPEGDEEPDEHSPAGTNDADALDADALDIHPDRVAQPHTALEACALVRVCNCEFVRLGVLLTRKGLPDGEFDATAARILAARLHETTGSRARPAAAEVEQWAAAFAVTHLSLEGQELTAAALARLLAECPPRGVAAVRCAAAARRQLDAGPGAAAAAVFSRLLEALAPEVARGAAQLPPRPAAEALFAFRGRELPEALADQVRQALCNRLTALAVQGDDRLKPKDCAVAIQSIAMAAPRRVPENDGYAKWPAATEWLGAAGQPGAICTSVLMRLCAQRTWDPGSGGSAAALATILWAAVAVILRKSGSVAHFAETCCSLEQRGWLHSVVRTEPGWPTTPAAARDLTLILWALARLGPAGRAAVPAAAAATVAARAAVGAMGGRDCANALWALGTCSADWTKETGSLPDWVAPATEVVEARLRDFLPIQGPPAEKEALSPRHTVNALWAFAKARLPPKEDTGGALAAEVARFADTGKLDVQGTVNSLWALALIPIPRPHFEKAAEACARRLPPAAEMSILHYGRLPWVLRQLGDSPGPAVAAARQDLAATAASRPQGPHPGGAADKAARIEQRRRQQAGYRRAPRTELRSGITYSNA